MPMYYFLKRLYLCSSTLIFCCNFAKTFLLLPRNHSTHHSTTSICLPSYYIYYIHHYSQEIIVRMSHDQDVNKKRTKYSNWSSKLHSHKLKRMQVAPKWRTNDERWSTNILNQQRKQRVAWSVLQARISNMFCETSRRTHDIFIENRRTKRFF